MKKYDSVDEYMNDQKGRGKEMLQEMRKLILEVIPNAIESMGYGTPAYGLIENAKLNEKIMIGNYKNHVAFYPHSETIVAFKERLKNYKCLVGTIQIKHTQELPIELLKEMVLYRYKAIHQ